jgi:DNA-binding NtrC family response regulator
LLNGLNVLVVEDDPTIAMYLQDVIERAEGNLVATLGSLSDARVFLGTARPVDAAVLDVNLSDGEVTPVLEALRARGTPVVIYTADAALPRRVAERHPDVLVLHNPVQPGRLTGELRRLGQSRLPRLGNSSGRAAG